MPEREAPFANFRCRVLGHKPMFVTPDPRPREYVQSGNRAGLPKLRKALTRCSRCGKTNE